MKKIIIGNDNQTVPSYNVGENVPVFAVRSGKICGMVVYENESKGWITRIGGKKGCSGHHNTREMCMVKDSKLGYTFHIDIDLEQT